MVRTSTQVQEQLENVVRLVFQELTRKYVKVIAHQEGSFGIRPDRDRSITSVSS